MVFFDFLKQIPTSSELKGEVGERLTSAIARIDIPEAIVMRDVLIDGYEDMSSYEIESDIKGWLIDWPSSDDKTIAYLLREEPSDE